METSRREFIRKIGITGLIASNLTEIISATDSVELTRDFNKNKGLTFLFQGDSITDGNRTRDNDWNHIMGHGYSYLIASRLWCDHTDKDLMFYNRGISGNRVKDLDARWQQDCLDLKPDVLSIMIGVNDIMSIIKDLDSEPIEKFEKTYKRILDKTKQALPNTQIILCEPFILPLGWVNEKTELWQTEIRKQQLLIRKLAESYDAVFVELQEPFNNACKKAPADYWIWDGIHPMPAGHELIARLWIKEVRKKLTFMKRRIIV
jgi:lysophospholipase L1-like esterase